MVIVLEECHLQFNFWAQKKIIELYKRKLKILYVVFKISDGQEKSAKIMPLSAASSRMMVGSMIRLDLHFHDVRKKSEKFLGTK